MSTILITGGTGCIGAATIHHLLQDDGIEKVVVVSRSGNEKLLRLWQDDPTAPIDARISMLSTDISDAVALGSIVADVDPTHLIHLGALQSPACDADPHLGMQINVGGVLSILDAAKKLPRLERFVFASSAAVYGKRAEYDMPSIPEVVPLHPPNLYGVWKLAGEELVRLFHHQTGVPCVSLRLNTTYGPGRDLGKTSAVTTAMKSVVLGHLSGESIPFRMPYQGRENYHYVRDVGHHFAACATLPFSGCDEFNIRGCTIQVSEFLDKIRKVAAQLGMSEAIDIEIVDSPDENLFICDLQDQRVQDAFPGMPRTDLDEGIQLSMEHFLQMAERGSLTI